MPCPFVGAVPTNGQCCVQFTRVMETEVVLDFLRYGGDAACIAALPASCTAPFLPSLALLASDSPSFSCSLLASHPFAPSALTYASLDFSPISHAVLVLLKEPDEDSLGYPLDSFSSADQKERAKNVIFSLRRRALQFMGIIESGEELEKAWHQQQNDVGSIWNSKLCLSELTCLLPIAAFRCPKLLLPEDFLWGLLPTQWGFVLLTYILLNNPLIVRKTLFLLSDFLRTHEIALLSSEHVLLSAQPYLPNKYAHVLHQHGRQNPTVLLCVKQAMLTFLQLSKLSSSLAHTCREVLVLNCACAGIAMYLTAESIHDELEFLSKIIFSDTNRSEWILGYFRIAKKDYVEELFDVIKSVEGLFFRSATKSDTSIHFQGSSLCIRKALLVDAQITKEKYGWSGRLCGHLRLYCVLVRAADLQPMPAEAEFWLQSLIDAEGSICEQSLQLGVSFFCLVPGLTMNAVIKSLFYKCVAALLNWKAFVETRCTSELNEQIVWFAVQLFLGRFSDIALVVREVMGMHVTVQNASIRELQNAAMAIGVISESSKLMQAVAALRPKGPLSSKVKHRQFTLECLEQLLKAGHFSRNGVDVSESILHCISISTAPIHGLLIQAIQAYTEAPPAIVHGSTGSHLFRMQPLPRSFLEDSMVTIPSLISNWERDGIVHNKVEATADTLLKEALTSYYILCRERVLRSNGAGSSESSLTAIFNPPYCESTWWAALLNRVPFHQLLHYMETRWLDFVHLFPQWLSLAASLFPERFLVPDLLASFIEPVTWAKGLDADLASDDKETTACLDYRKSGSYVSQTGGFQDTDAQIHESVVTLNTDYQRTVMEDVLADPLSASQLLDDLNLNASVSKKRLSKELIDRQVLVVRELVPMLLDPLCKRCLQEKFCAWFKNLQPLVRQAILPVFVEVILDTSLEPNESGSMMQQLKTMKGDLDITRTETYSNLVQQPLILLACKLKVYRTPLVSTVLDVLHELRTVNRRVFVELVSQKLSGELSLTSEEVCSALLAQDSAMCQILLEACLPNVGLGDNLEPGPLLETCKMICGFLAPLLESNHLLLELLHFQGYDPQLVPVMAKGVPAMVRCLDFMPEFLQKQQQCKQVFTINTVANIACTHEEHPESLAAVHKIVAHVKNAGGGSSFMQGVLGAMVECACTFRVVAADVVNIVQDSMRVSGPIKLGGPPRDPPLYTSALSAFKHLTHSRALLRPHER